MTGRVNRIKFPLKMKDGTQARTIEDLREHFDYKSVLEYYQNGKLKSWLEDRYYTDEAELIGPLRPSADGLMQEICKILGVEYYENKTDIVSITSVARKNNNYERLKKHTADDEILKNADKVAFSQDELLGLLDKGEKEIYLCEGDFVIPGDIENTKYIGVDEPYATIHGETIKEGIEIKNVNCDISGYVESMSCFERVFQNNPKLGFSILNENIERSKEYPRYLRALAWCYENGFGTEKKKKTAFKYYSQFAEIDNAEGAYYLACYYKNRCNYEEARDWFARSVSNGFTASMVELGNLYCFGQGVYTDYNKAIELWKKAASKGDPYATYHLAHRYFDGKGVEIDKRKGIELFRQSYENGCQDAIFQLLRYAPREVKINDALLFVLGGKDNLHGKIVLLKDNCFWRECRFGIMLIEVRNITKIRYNDLLKVNSLLKVFCTTSPTGYVESSSNITFFGDEKKMKAEEDVVIVLEELCYLDAASINALKTELTVDEFDMTDTQDYWKIFDKTLKKLQKEHVVIESCETFLGARIDLIEGKNQIESCLEECKKRF